LTRYTLVCYSTDMDKTIVVLAADSQEALEARGAEIEFTFDAIKEAKAKAKYYLTEEYMNVCESSSRLGYSQVVVNGEVAYDYFGKSRPAQAVPEYCKLMANGSR
jgi:hypothetical protein